MIRGGNLACVLDVRISISRGINVGTKFFYWRETQGKKWKEEKKELRSLEMKTTKKSHSMH